VEIAGSIIGYEFQGKRKLWSRFKDALLLTSGYLVPEVANVKTLAGRSSSDRMTRKHCFDPRLFNT